MGITERREREKEALRTRIVEAARDIVSEEGLDALSMRAIAERIEYSPATIYLYFRDKGDLIHEVVTEGFKRMGEYIRQQLEKSGAEANAAEQHKALGRGYARFGIENTAYFRVMFELPTVAQLECGGAERCADAKPEHSMQTVVETVQRAMDAGLFQLENAQRGAVVAWAMIHGLTSLYLSGHLADTVDSHDAFLELVEGAMDTLGHGLRPRETGGGAGA